MIYQVGKKQCSNSGRKRNDIAPLESDFMVQPPSLLEFPGPLTPPPPWNFQFPPWWGSGYFLEPHIYIFFLVTCSLKHSLHYPVTVHVPWSQRFFLKVFFAKKRASCEALTVSHKVEREKNLLLPWP